MNLSRKLEGLEPHIASIANHRDESKAVRIAVLDEAIAAIERAKVRVAHEDDQAAAPAAAE